MILSNELLTDELINELMPILETHRVELSRFKDMPLNPDWEKYKIISSLGKCMWYTVRNNDGMLLGYSVIVIDNNMHYKDFLYAIQDIFYIIEGNRTSIASLKLLRFIEKDLKEKGVSVVIQHAKLTNRFSELLTKLDYTMVENSFLKRLQ
jgi:hypothetical protein